MTEAQKAKLFRHFHAGTDFYTAYSFTFGQTNDHFGEANALWDKWSTDLHIMSAYANE